MKHSLHNKMYLITYMITDLLFFYNLNYWNNFLYC